MSFTWLAASRAAADSAHQGGDFFDVSEPERSSDSVSGPPEGKFRVLIGDVMGHGSAEAHLADRLAEAWRGLVHAGTGEPGLLPALDEVLMAAEPTSAAGLAVFATACAVTLSPGQDSTQKQGRWQIEVRLAGHPAPLLRTTSGARYLEAPAGPPLGMRTPGLTASWPVGSAQLEAGDVLVLYTDGLLDSYADQGSDGTAELARAVASIDRGSDVETWASTLISAGHRAAGDDSLVLVLSLAL